MNAILLGAASLGAIAVFFTHDPHANFARLEPVAVQRATIEETAVPTKAIIKAAVPAKTRATVVQKAAQKAAKQAADQTPEKGSMTTTVELDPDTGEKTGEINVIAFLD